MPSTATDYCFKERLLESSVFGIVVHDLSAGDLSPSAKVSIWIEFYFQTEMLYYVSLDEVPSYQT